MSTQFDYHQLVLTIQKKDLAIRRMLDSMTSDKGFTGDFKARIYYLVGDYGRTIPPFTTWGIGEAMRPSRKEVRHSLVLGNT